MRHNLIKTATSVILIIHLMDKGDYRTTVFYQTFAFRNANYRQDPTLIISNLGNNCTSVVFDKGGETDTSSIPRGIEGHLRDCVTVMGANKVV